MSLAYSCLEFLSLIWSFLTGFKKTCFKDPHHCCKNLFLSKFCILDWLTLAWYWRFFCSVFFIKTYFEGRQGCYKQILWSFSMIKDQISCVLHEIWIMLATHREEFEERVLENLPLLILVSDHWNVDFAEILREQEDQTDRAVGKQKTRQNMSLSRSPKAWSSLTAISVNVLPYISVRERPEQVKTHRLHSRQPNMILIIVDYGWVTVWQ